MSVSAKIRVVLIDDDEEDYLLTADMLAELSRQPYSLEWLPTPAEARSRFASDPPDICLLDYRLGPEDGISLIPEFRRSGFNGPIVMLTGQRDRKLEDAALAAGAVDYLSKQDVDAYELERSLRYALMRRQAETHERERLEADALRREAEAASQAKSEFLAYISHELRTPLAALLSYSDLLSLHVSDRSMARYTSAISRNGRHLQALLDDLLDLSLIETAKLELDIQESEINQLIANVVATAQIQCRAKGLEFMFELPEALPKRFATDKKRLTQMLFNLLGNAIKFTEQGSVTFRVKYAAEPAALRFEIQDTGPGISDTDRERIFEPFHRLNGVSNQGGIGLGLTITARLAEALEARLELQSTPGKGACFALSLPGDSAAPLERVVRDELLQPDLASSIPGNLDGLIVVVDDSEDIRKSISGLLSRVGAQVRALSSGSELLSLFKSDAFKPDLILLDMQMPDLDGYDVARILRERGVEVPIIALTAAVFEGAREACLAAGCNDYLSKPVESVRLFRHLADWLDGDGQRRSEIETAVDPDEEEPSAPDVIVVDDAADGREALRDLLQLQGFQVETAASESEAARLIGSSLPRSVLLDINLGAGSGVTLARSMRLDEKLKDTRIIGLSGRALEELAADERLLFDAFLTKPVHLKDVLQALEDCGITLG